MKDNLYKLAALALIVVAFGGAAFAQDYGHKVRAEVPFSFYAGNKVLPAGTYYLTINAENHSVAVLENASRHGFFLSGAPADGSKSGVALLSFRTNGEGIYILQKAEWPDFGVSFKLDKSLAAVEQATSAQVTTIVADAGK